MMALSGLQGAAYLLPLVSVPYLVRVLGSGNFGRTAFALACVQYLVLIVDFGFGFSATRRSALLRDNHAELDRLVSCVAAVRVLLCAVAGIILCAAVALVPPFSADAPLYLAAYLVVVGQALLPGWLLQGLGRMHVLAACVGAGQLLTLAGLLLLVGDPADYRLAVALQGAGACAAAMVAWAYLLAARLARLKWPSRSGMQEAVVEGWPFFLSGASVSLYTSSNTVLLGLVGTPQAVGYFAAADKLVRAVQGLIAPVSQAVYPHVARLAGQSRARTLSFLHKLLKWQGSATLGLSLATFVFAQPLVHLLFGPTFDASVPIVACMAALPAMVGLSNVFGVQTMLNFGMQSSFNRILVVSGVVNVLLVCLLAPGYGGLGVAASIMVTELVVLGAMGFILRRAGLLSPILQGKVQ